MSSAARALGTSAGGTGIPSSPARPTGVAFTTMVHSAGRARGNARSSAHSSSARARSGDRERTATAAPRRPAATRAARAPPPVPTISHGPSGGDSSSTAARTPATSVLSPTISPSRAQKALHIPTSRAVSISRSTAPAATSLWGMVTLPPPPAAARARTSPGTAEGSHWSGTYTAGRPSARKAAFCMSCR